MTQESVTRRLAAILAADVASYTRLVEEDTAATVAAWQTARDGVIDPGITKHAGRIIKLTGDGFLAEFHTVQDAVECAIELQNGLKPGPLDFRMGVSLGDITDDGQDVHGEGVNIAARLEALADSGGICVSGDVYHQVRNRIDEAFEDWGEQNVKHVSHPVRVYAIERFVANLGERVSTVSGGTGRSSAAREKRLKFGAALVAGAVAVVAIAAFLLFPQDESETTPTGPRLAVIPFKNLSNAREEDFFSDGLTKDINAQLSRFTNLFVIAPSSVRGFRDNSSCEHVRAELKADYILEGSLRRSQNDLRVTTSFIDAKTCRQLDSPGPFDRDLSVKSVLDIQFEIAKRVVAEIGSADAPLFNSRIQDRIRRKAPESIAAYECVLLSYWFYETFAPDRHRRARTCLERAVETNPDYSLGWSRLAFSYIESKKYAIDTPANWAELSRSAAERAVDIDPDNPNAYYALAILTQMTTKNSSVFRELARKAVDLNPNDAFILADLGTWMGYSGEWELGKRWVARAKLLNPKHQSWLDYIWHLHHYLKGEYRDARDIALRINLPGNYMVQASLTAAYAMNDELEKAKSSLEHLLKIRPDYADDPRAPFQTRGMPKELIEGLMDGLRKAGLEIRGTP